MAVLAGTTEQVNEVMTPCSDCERMLPAGEGHKVLWVERYVCPTCEERREQAARERTAKEIRQGDVLNSLIPAVSKAGQVVRIQSGRDQYQSSADVVLKDGKRYRVVVTELDETDS